MVAGMEPLPHDLRVIFRRRGAESRFDADGVARAVRLGKNRASAQPGAQKRHNVAFLSPVPQRAPLVGLIPGDNGDKSTSWNEKSGHTERCACFFGPSGDNGFD